MNIFSYGRVYSKLSPKQIKKVGFVANIDDRLLFLSKIYFFIFGYPDIASQRRYLTIEKALCLKKNDVVLDAGCGNGIYLQEFSNKFGIKGLGIDAQSSRIKKAKMVNKYLGGSNIFMTSTLERAYLGKKKFDKIICLEVLEHIRNDTQVVRKLSKKLKKGGVFIISVPMIGTALSKEQESNPNFKPEKYEHVRSGYEIKDLLKFAKMSKLKIVSIEEGLYFISRNIVKIQHFFYKRNLTLLNLLFSPILLLICSLDEIIKIYPRDYTVILKKERY